MHAQAVEGARESDRSTAENVRLSGFGESLEEPTEIEIVQALDEAAQAFDRNTSDDSTGYGFVEEPLQPIQADESALASDSNTAEDSKGYGFAEEPAQPIADDSAQLEASGLNGADDPYGFGEETFYQELPEPVQTGDNVHTGGLFL
jgi:hypothetical protein